ncbi:MAG: DUF2652 domain-containing protein, partial [Chloroflexi bacterium]|nr:DUF2652 domain-containing protein [Chloroflexota bacterium]
MASSASTGYLLIGDISGYTSYVAATEIEHSQAVLAELLELLIQHTSPLLTLSKLEGDAIFCYTPRERVTRGESLLEMIEAIYAAFRARVESIQRHTTCECNACRMIPKLDLKFMVHFGEYIQQKVANISELLGSDVNLVHRLTKNDVTQATGWNAYALFSEAALGALGLGTEGMHQQAAAYEHLGEIQTYSLNLRARYEEMLKTREVVVRPEEAHGQFSTEFAAPPSVVWEWLSDPHRRNLWQPGNVWNAVSRPGGRTAIGATNHCHHGKDATAEEIIRDWRPFDYFTVEAHFKAGSTHLFDNFETFTLEPLDDGRRTRLASRVRIVRGGLLRRPIAFMMYRMMDKPYKLLGDLIQKESGSPIHTED